IAITFGPLHALDGPTNDLLLVHSQFELTMYGTRGKKDMNSYVAAMLERLPSTIDVASVAAGQSANRCSFDSLGNLADGLEVADRCDGEARFDHVDLQIHQGLSDLKLFAEVHAAAGGLLAIAQGSVED